VKNVTMVDPKNHHSQETPKVEKTLPTTVYHLPPLVVGLGSQV
jgi:hypothetical protein